MFVLDHVSASQLKMFRRCPEQYRQRYVLGRKEPPAGALIWGSAHHKAVEMNFMHKVSTYQDLPAPELMERFAVEVDERIDEAGGASEVEWKDETPITVKDRGAKLVQIWRNNAAPLYQPTSVERQFSVPLPGLPPLEGRIDVEAALVEPFKLPLAEGSEMCRECGEDLTLSGIFALERGLCAICAGDVIVDNKTAGKKGLPDDARLQGWLYQLDRPLDYFVDVAVKTQSPYVITGEYHIPLGPRDRTLGVVTRVVSELKRYLEEYGEEEPWPDAIDRRGICSFCGFGPNASKLCPWWQDTGWRPKAVPSAL